MGFVEDTRFGEFGAICVFFDRLGGVSPPPFDSLNVSTSSGDSLENVRKNLEIVKNTIGAQEIFTVNQIHSNVIVPYIPNRTFEADGIFTDKSGVFIGIKTADCLPIALMDTKKKIVMAIHAGWRGTFLNIARRAMAIFRELGSNQKDILVTIGPHICGNCYEVKEDVASKFGDRFITRRDNKLFLDLSKANQEQLASESVPKGNIKDLNICTFERKDFFSYRRNGICGRNIGGIMLVDTHQIK